MRGPGYRTHFCIETDTGFTTLCLLLLFGLAGCATIEPPPDTVTLQADALLERLTLPEEPGLAVTVVRDGRVLLSKGYGIANLEYDIPITDRTTFNVASVSKQFTAISILMLEERGKLSLDEDIRMYLDYIPEFGEAITIRQLLYHTSGLRDQWELLFLAGWHPDDVIFQEQIIRMIRMQEDLNFQPGSDFLYSNTGYTLLAEIVSSLTGQTFKDWTHANIFEPLGMMNTHFQDNHEEIIPGRAYPYLPDRESGQFRISIQNHANVGATSLFTSAADMSRWLLNFETGKVGGLELIRRMESDAESVSVNPIEQEGSSTYGFALYHDHFLGLKRIHHSGEGVGFQSYFARFPDQNFGISIMSNSRAFSVETVAEILTLHFLTDVIETVPVQRVQVRPAEEPGEIFLISLMRFLYGAVVSLFQDGDEDPEIPGETEAAGPDLSDYRGRFFSDELETIYNIYPVNDLLIIEYRQKGLMVMQKTDDDRFSVIYHNYLGYVPREYIRFRFDRSESGTVSGFYVDMARIRNLRFARLD